MMTTTGGFQLWLDFSRSVLSIVFYYRKHPCLGSFNAPTLRNPNRPTYSIDILINHWSLTRATKCCSSGLQGTSIATEFTETCQYLFQHPTILVLTNLLLSGLGKIPFSPKARILLWCRSLYSCTALLQVRQLVNEEVEFHIRIIHRDYELSFPLQAP